MELLLATREGLWLSADGSLAPLIDGADFLALARSAADGAYYAASRGGQVYRSLDRARSWQPAGAVTGFEELSSLAVDPQNPDRILAGMEPAALMVSENGARSWQPDPAIPTMARAGSWSVPWSSAAGHVRTIAVDPNVPDCIYLAIEVGGVVRSEDGGQSWENVHGGIHDDVHSVVVHPTDSAVVYAATRHGFGRSEDFGKTWRRIDGFEGQGYARPLAVDPQRGERVYTAAATVGPGGFSRPSGTECGVFRSDDGGLAWTRLTNGLPSHFKPYVDALDVSPSEPDSVALADSEGHVYESIDGGESWRQTGKAPPVRRLLAVG